MNDRSSKGGFERQTGIRSRNYQGFQAFLRGFMQLPGSTLQDKTRSFLAHYAGLTEMQIAAIEDILIDKSGK